MSIVVLLEATPRRADTGAAVTIRLVWNAAARADYFGVQWLPLLAELPEFETDLGFDGSSYGQGATPSVGAIGIALDAASAAWAGLVWKNAPLSLRIAPKPLDRSRDPADGDFGAPLAYRADTLSQEDAMLRIVALDPGQDLRKAVQPVKFGSSGNALLDGTGTADLAGQVVPLGWGRLLAVPGMLVDRTHNIWLFLGRPATSIESLEDGGVPFAAGVARASLAALRASVPAAGACDYCLDAGGLVLARPWTPPTYPFLADLTAGSVRPADIAASIVAGRSAVGFTAGTIAAFNAVEDGPAQLYVADATTIAAALDRLFPPLGAFWKLRSAGTIDLGRLALAGVPVQRFGAHQIARITRRGLVMPTRRRTLGFAMANCGALGEGDIARTLLDEQARADAAAALAAADAAQADANAARIEADAARADAAAANAQVAIIASDGILSRGEKSEVINRWNAIAAENARMDATAARLGITTERSAWILTLQLLANYLNSLSPYWADVTQDTPINATAFRMSFSDYYAARQALDDAIAAETARRAVWLMVDGVGKPQDNADVTGVNIAAGIVGQGALATLSKIDWANDVIGALKPITYRVRTRGFEATLPGGDVHLGLWNETTQAQITSVSTSYTVAILQGGTWVVRYYDILNDPVVYSDVVAANVTSRQAMTLHLLNYNNNTRGLPVVVLGWDEPAIGRLGGAYADYDLPQQMYKCGASRAVFGSARFPVRGAYCLVGQTNAGEGNGAEYLAGIGDRTQAFVDLTFGIVNGVLGIAGVTPSDARDLVYASGISIEQLKPFQPNADTTALNTAAAIAGQAAWATYGGLNPPTVAGQVSRLDGGGTLQASHVYLPNVNFLNNVFPGEYGANVTEGRTAAAITAQGRLATTDRVNLGVGGGIANQANTVWMTDADLITVQGTAAAIAGQGIYATTTPARLNPHPFFGSAYLDANIVAYDGPAGNVVGALKPAQVGSDVTILNTASALAGQGVLATRNVADWETMITGTGKPISYADVTNANVAAGIAGQGALATLSTVQTGNVAANAITNAVAVSGGAILNFGGAGALNGLTTTISSPTGAQVLILATSVYVWETGSGNLQAAVYKEQGGSGSFLDVYKNALSGMWIIVDTPSAGSPVSYTLQFNRTSGGAARAAADHTILAMEIKR